MHEHDAPEQGHIDNTADDGRPAEASDDTKNVGHVEVGDDDRAVTAETTHPHPNIWVGSWLDYNNGRLHGTWIDAARDDDSIWADIQAMLRRSPTAAQTGDRAEDWGIFDFDNFGPLRIGEQESVGWVAAVARGIAEHGLGFAAYADVMQDLDALDGFADDYLGEWPSLQTYVEEMAEDCEYNRVLDDALPDSIRPYIQIDTAALARDMQLDGDIHVVPNGDGGVWLFHAS